MSKEQYQRRYTIPSLEDAMAKVASRIKGVHEACSAVPKIRHQDFDELVDSIKAHGLLRPIEIDNEGQLIDGRSRLQACLVAEAMLADTDIVVTNADPWAISRSNNARRHLTRDQKAMEAGRLLEKEREVAAQRKAQGAKKGRQSKQCSLGTDSVPSDVKPKKRQPRATDKVAAATGVSREDLSIAEKVIKADAKLAEKVEAGETSLDDAAAKIGCAPKKRVKPIVAKPAKQSPAKSAANATPTVNPSVWQDEHTELTDSTDGIRTVRCREATFYIHKTKPLLGVVMPEGDEWWWYAGTDADQGITPQREDAERNILTRLTANEKGKP